MNKRVISVLILGVFVALNVWMVVQEDPPPEPVVEAEPCNSCDARHSNIKRLSERKLSLED